MRPHGALDWLLIYTLSGSGLYHFENGIHFESHADDITLFRPGVPHEYKCASKGWDLLFAHFLPRASWLTWFDWKEITPGAMALKVADSETIQHIRKNLKIAIARNRSALRRAEDFAMSALEETFLWCDVANPRTAGGRLDTRLQRACDYLIEHLEEPFHQIDLEKITGLSESRLRRMFRAQLGFAPRDFHENQKMKRARQLLMVSQHTIGEIAGELGFENPFYFTLRFKKVTGMCPRDFRRLQVTKGGLREDEKTV